MGTVVNIKDKLREKNYWQGKEHIQDQLGSLVSREQFQGAMRYAREFYDLDKDLLKWTSEIVADYLFYKYRNM